MEVCSFCIDRKDDLVDHVLVVNIEADQYSRFVSYARLVYLHFLESIQKLHIIELPLSISMSLVN